MSQVTNKKSIFPKNPRLATAPGVQPNDSIRKEVDRIQQDTVAPPREEKAKNALALVGGLGLGVVSLIVGSRIIGGGGSTETPPAPVVVVESQSAPAENQQVIVETYEIVDTPIYEVSGPELTHPSEVAAQSVETPSDPVLAVRNEMFERAAERHQIPSFYLKAISWHRSQWTPDYESGDGVYVGIMGLSQAQVPLHGPNAGLDASNPTASLDFAAESLQHLYANTGSWSEALMYFTAESGPGFGALPVEGYHHTIQDLVRQAPWQSQAIGNYSREQVNSVLTDAAARHGVPVEYLQSLAWARSGFDNLQISEDGNQFGLFGLHADFSSDFFESHDWRSPEAQADYVAQQLAESAPEYSWTPNQGYDHAMRDFILENANYADKYENFPETQVLALLETTPWAP